MTRDWADYPYVRLYSSIDTDKKFVNVRDNDAALAWYVRLLFMAHAAHPAPAYLPRVPRKVLATLSDAGLIAVNGSRFTMSGVAKERAEVADLAHRAGGTVRAATADRDDAGRFVAGIPLDQRPSSDAGPAPIDVLRAREVRSTTEDDYDGRDDVEAYVQVRRRAPTPGQRQVLDNILARHDVTGPRWAADIILANPQDPIGAVIKADNEWRAAQKSKAIADERESAERHRRPRGLSGVNAEIAKAMAERYGDEGAVA